MGLGGSLVLAGLITYIKGSKWSKHYSQEKRMNTHEEYERPHATLVKMRRGRGAAVSEGGDGVAAANSE